MQCFNGSEQNVNTLSLKEYTILSKVSDGARCKMWVCDKNGSEFLYKKNKVFPNSGTYTYESYSEYFSKKLCDQLEIPCVDIILGTDAILSKKMWDCELKSFLDYSEELEHSFHLSNLTTYDISTLLSSRNRFRDEIIQMLFFDALIGNSDRHPGNYLFNEDKGFYPLFDNGSSLCCYIEDTKVDKFLNNRDSFRSLMFTKSKPVLRTDQKITHFELVEILKKIYTNQYKDFCMKISNLDLDVLGTVGLPDKRVDLLRRFIGERAKWFQ